MSNEMFTAVASVVTAIFTVFGVKFLDTLAGRHSKKFDELSSIRASQQTRIESLEKSLDAKSKEFDEYQERTNARFEKLNEELWDLRARNRELTRTLEKYEREQNHGSQQTHQ